MLRSSAKTQLGRGGYSERLTACDWAEMDIMGAQEGVLQVGRQCSGT